MLQLPETCYAHPLLLMHPDIDCNATDSEKDTALHLACATDHIDIVKLLLNQPNIDCNAKNNLYETPLMRAAHHDYNAIVSLMVQKAEVELLISLNGSTRPR